MIRKIVLLLLLLVLLCVLAYQEVLRRWREPLVVPAAGLTLVVAPGESLRAVANRLHREGVLRYPEMLVLYARWHRIDQQIKHGEYFLPGRLEPISLLELLVSGRVVEYQVTLPEGITAARAILLLAAQPPLQSTLSGPDDPRVKEIIKPYPEPEGLFFPDTYSYARGSLDSQVLQRAHARMLEVLDQEWQDRAPGLPYETPYEALVMASIIERETGLPEEREQIAGVFVRRLQQGMRLQTDPTVIYGLGNTFDGDLLRKHLADENNAYNTYRHDGLPPTPIALAGRAAIHAALHPADGQDLFFVARGDGGHEFSATLAEHERAVRKFQLQRREGYRSSPENL